MGEYRRLVLVWVLLGAVAASAAIGCVRRPRPTAVQVCERAAGADAQVQRAEVAPAWLIAQWDLARFADMPNRPLSSPYAAWPAQENDTVCVLAGNFVPPGAPGTPPATRMIAIVRPWGRVVPDSFGPDSLNVSTPLDYAREHGITVPPRPS